MRVLVCGSRNLTDEVTKRKLEDLLNIVSKGKVITVVEGGCKGPDEIAREWAIKNKKKVETFNADWKSLGRSAGPIRNRKMVETLTKDDICIAVHDGVSKGTKNTIELCKKKGIMVINVK